MQSRFPVFDDPRVATHSDQGNTPMHSEDMLRLAEDLLRRVIRILLTPKFFPAEQKLRQVR